MGLLKELCDPVREFASMGITRIAYEKEGEEISTVSTKEFAEAEIPTWGETTKTMGKKALLAVLGEQILRWDTKRMYDREPPKDRVFESRVLARILLPLIVNKRPTYSMAQVLSAHHHYGIGKRSEYLAYYSVEKDQTGKDYIEPVYNKRHDISFLRFRPNDVRVYSGGMYVDRKVTMQNATAHLCGGNVFYKPGFVYGNHTVQLLQLSSREVDGSDNSLFSLPGGGHTKSRKSVRQGLADVTGLRESLEETDITHEDLLMAAPLGLALQVVSSTRDGGIVVYLNYVWVTAALAGHSREEGKTLVTFGDDARYQDLDLDLAVIAREKPLTPLALLTIKMLCGR